MARATAPVRDWSQDFDVLDPGYIENPFRIWDDLRESCPIAHTERRGGAWMLTRYADVVAAAHDVERFSSLEVGVINNGVQREPEEDPAAAVWPSADLCGPAPAHLDTADHIAVVLPQARRRLRGDDP